MKETKKSKIIIVLILLSLVTCLFPLNSIAMQPCTIRGYVYIDDVITEPDEVSVVFSSQTGYADLYSDGYYIIDISEDIGQIGQFYVNYQGKNNIANETVTIIYDTYSYEINLHIASSQNNPPDIPINPTPANNSENIGLNPAISVYVTDSDGDSMTVSFYNASDDSQISTSVVATNKSTASVDWTDLDFNKTYSWYAISNDSQFETKSDVFNFKTKTEENQAPEITIIKPKSGALYINNNLIFSDLLQMPLILGNITIQVNATDNDSLIDRVEISINGFLMDKTYNLTDEPYEVYWDKFAFGQYTIDAVAYDTEGDSSQDSITLRKFF